MLVHKDCTLHTSPLIMQFCATRSRYTHRFRNTFAGNRLLCEESWLKCNIQLPSIVTKRP